MRRYLDQVLDERCCCSRQLSQRPLPRHTCCSGIRCPSHTHGLSWHAHGHYDTPYRNLSPWTVTRDCRKCTTFFLHLHRRRTNCQQVQPRLVGYRHGTSNCWAYTSEQLLHVNNPGDLYLPLSVLLCHRFAVCANRNLHLAEVLPADITPNQADGSRSESTTLQQLPGNS